MLYGQELDKHYETVHASESELLELHAHKTGALIIAGVDLGCDAAQADDACALPCSIMPRSWGWCSRSWMIFWM